MSNFRVYIGTYRKYNNGNLFGKWIDLQDFSDKEEFIEACKKLHANEEDPELMFQDWEGIPESMISESHISDAVFDYMEAVEEYGFEKIEAYIHCFGEWDFNKFKESYIGKFDNREAFASYYLNDLGYFSKLPAEIEAYFDFDAYARDMEYNGSYCEHNGHYFWNNN